MIRKRSLVLVSVVCISAALLTASCERAERNGTGVLLPTGKGITAATQPAQEVGSMPMNIAVTANGRYAVTSDIGFYQWMWSLRTADGVGVSRVAFANPAPRRGAAPVGGEDNAERAAAGSARTNGLYYGLAIAGDNTVYAGQGGHDSIAVLSLSAEGKLAMTGSIQTKRFDFPAGLALDDAGHLYVANNAVGDANPVTLAGSMAIYDTASKKELGRYTFSESHGGTSNFPYAVAALRDGSKAYVASERDDGVYVLGTGDPRRPVKERMIGTGAHPTSLLLTRDGGRLYVSNSLGDTVSVVDTRTDAVVGTVFLRPKSVRDVPGVTPLGMALSADEKTLYVALADMNAVAVIDAQDAELRGYVPAGWYPTSLAVTGDGERLLVVNAKGTRVRNPNNRTDPHDPKTKTGAALSVLEGNVLSVELPTGKELEESTEEVMAENRIAGLERAKKNPLAGIALGTGKIKHVIYVIKENRTYDQVLGDVAEGNGDASLVLFGKDVTPNQHALAERFVLLDNLYACGEVSGDGWAWSTQGMADAYVARNVPYSYSHRGRKFDFEAANNGYPTGGAPAVDSEGKPLATTQPFTQGVPAIPDVGNTGRNLWDAAAEAKLTLRNYGFFLFFTDKNSGTPGGPDNWPAAIGLSPAGHDLAGVTDQDFRRFDLDYPDSDGPQKYFAETGEKRFLSATTKYGKYGMPSRFMEWNREFQMMLAKDPGGGAVPELMLVRLPTDHTSAAKAGKHSPKSYVADNDYAVGELVEAVSHSAIWGSTAIFVIEDDAQNGVDHVDSHRTTGYLISPFIKRHSVDHRFYNTDSFLKTMELLLGLKPLSQYDAVADPILDWTTAGENAAPFEAILPAKGLMGEINPAVAELPVGDGRRELAIRSEKMDFTHADAAPALETNEIVWKTVKGAGSEMPRPRGDVEKDDDDD